MRKRAQVKSSKLLFVTKVVFFFSLKNKHKFEIFFFRFVFFFFSSDKPNFNKLIIIFFFFSEKKFVFQKKKNQQTNFFFYFFLFFFIFYFFSETENDKPNCLFVFPENLNNKIIYLFIPITNCNLIFFFFRLLLPDNFFPFHQPLVFL